MPYTEYLAAQMLDATFGAVAYTPPPSIYIGLLGAETWVASQNVTSGSTYVISANFASSVHNLFVCSLSGTTNSVGEPAWITTAGGVTSDGSAQWTEVSNLFAAGTFSGAELPFTAGYARGLFGNGADATNNLTNWPSASGGPPREKASGTICLFPTPTATWLQEVGFIACTAATGGSVLAWQLFGTPIVAGLGSGPPDFGIGEIQITMQ